MIVNTNDRRVDTIASGSTPSFDFDFAILAATDIAAYWNGIAIGSLGVTMTVSGAGDEDGGSVTFSGTPTAGTIVTLLGSQPASALTRYINVQTLPLQQIENDFARAVILSQQILEILGRVPQLAVSSMLRDIFLPDGEAGTVLRWETATRLQNINLDNIVPAGSVVLPVTLLDGGTGGAYATREAMILGLNLAQWKRAPDVATAATLALPNPLGGNLFKTTGSVAISAISTGGIAEGTVIWLQYTSNVHMTAGASLNPIGGADHDFMAGDQSIWLFSGTTWWEVVRQPFPVAGQIKQFWRGDGSWQSLVAAKGDLLTYDTDNAILPVGTDGQRLAADSGEAAGLKWVDAAPLTMEFVSSDQTITFNSSLNVAHGLGVVPKLLEVVLKCVSTEGNYAVNDEVSIGSRVEADSALGCVIGRDATNVTINTSAGITILNKTTHGSVALTAAKWKYRIRAWA